MLFAYSNSQCLVCVNYVMKFDKIQDQRKVVALNQLQRLRERVRDEGVETKVKMLVSLMQSLKVD